MCLWSQRGIQFAQMVAHDAQLTARRHARRNRPTSIRIEHRRTQPRAVGIPRMLYSVELACCGFQKF